MLGISDVGSRKFQRYPVYTRESHKNLEVRNEKSCKSLIEESPLVLTLWFSLRGGGVIDCC